jgi:hypothetical protein
MLGDHGRWKKHSPYHASVGVPMVIAGPGVESQTVDAPATTLDLHATMLDYAGLDAGDVDSRSLRPVLEGERAPTDHREVVHSGLGPWRLAYDGTHKLIEGYDPAHRPAWDLGLGDKDQVAAFEESDREPAAVRAERERLLFDVGAGERVDRSADRPGVAAALTDWLADFEAR